jgi:ankyrin repeat protein
MVKLLLSRGADPNATASYKRTPLICARQYAPNEEMIDLLIQYGAQDTP